MNTKQITLLGSLVLLLTQIGCGQSINTAQPTKTLPTFTGTGWAGSNFAATFQVIETQWYTLDSGTGLSQEATAYLWDSVHHVPVDGGTVSMNTTTIPQLDETSFSGGKYYDYFNCAMGLTGLPLIFSASGGSTFAALKDTITFPNSIMSISAPGIADTLSKAAGFAIHWSHVTGSTDTIALQIAGDSVGVFQALVPDNGSYTITSSDLSTFTTGGKIVMAVGRRNTKLQPTHWGELTAWLRARMREWITFLSHSQSTLWQVSST